MKTTRRQELRTNELSQQIDQIGEYVKRNALMLTVVVVVGAGVVAGGFWFVKGRQSRIMGNWAALNDSELLSDPSAAIEHLRGIAADAGDPNLASAAWMKIGDLAMAEFVSADSGAGPEKPDVRKDWNAIAQEAYEHAIGVPSKNLVAEAQAMMMLGVIAENNEDFSEARQWYEKIAADARFAQTPFPDQARHRAAGLDLRSRPVVFAPPVVTVPSPDASAESASADPVAALIGQTDGDSTPTSAPADGMSLPGVAVPTSQPAGG